MTRSNQTRSRLNPIWRALVEAGFIVFLFYANLLMGEFTRSAGKGKTMAAALCNIITTANFSIALVSAFIGYFVVEFLRKRL
jgi:Na+/melibiose symporter-like transporter